MIFARLSRYGRNFFEDRREDQEVGEKPHEIYPQAALIRPGKEQKSHAIQTLDDECGGEGQETTSRVALQNFRKNTPAVTEAVVRYQTTAKT